MEYMRWMQPLFYTYALGKMLLAAPSIVCIPTFFRLRSQERLMLYYLLCIIYLFAKKKSNHVVRIRSRAQG